MWTNTSSFLNFFLVYFVYYWLLSHFLILIHPLYGCWIVVYTHYVNKYRLLLVLYKTTWHSISSLKGLKTRLIRLDCSCFKGSHRRCFIPLAWELPQWASSTRKSSEFIMGVSLFRPGGDMSVFWLFIYMLKYVITLHITIYFVYKS